MIKKKFRLEKNQSYYLIFLLSPFIFYRENVNNMITSHSFLLVCIITVSLYILRHICK